MHIAFLIGGTNTPSNSEYLATQFGQELEKNGASVEIIRLRDLPIEHFRIEHYSPAPPEEPEFAVIRTAIQKADGLVMATPIWNFGVPANLKNVVDRIGAFGLDSQTRSKGQLNDLPVFFIYTGGAPWPAWEGMMRFTTAFMREGLRYFGAAPVGSYFEGKCVPGKGEFGLVVDQRPEAAKNIRKEARAFLNIVRSQKETGALPFKSRLKKKGMQWGDKILRSIFT